ncbi:MAG TPA: RusA family crossover junction endodeoxyribonuclease [Clostridium sp.]|uniref:RusA family crossover junction endodeoxyribonuclease n=1 Tax=Clostridium sp. TaxID=1506 RepID=UPI002F92DE0D
MKYKGGKPFAMAMMYETAEAKKFKKNMVKLIKEEIIKQEFKFETKPYFVMTEWTFFFPKTNMDSNNYFKTFLDAITNLNGLIWEDDNISMVKDANIYYDSENARAEVKIYASPRVGIFNDKSEYDTFVNTYCSKCKKGNKIGLKGGCSVYKNAMESRIKEEIPMATEEERLNKVCLKIKLK